MKTNFLMLLILFIYILVQNSLHAQNVGISNDASFTTPQSPLHIYWTSDGNLLQLSRSSAANTGLIFSVSGNNFSINNYQAGNLSLFTNNTERLRIPNAAQILAVGDGTAGAPAWSFVNSTTMGMYRSAADQLSFSTGSTERLRIPNAAQILAVGDGTAAAPAWSFVNSTTMGIYRSAADQLSFSTGSTERLRIPNAAQILAVGDGTAAAPAWSFVNNTTMGMYRSAANQLSFSTNSAERVRINSDGSIRLTYYTSGANGAILRTNSSGDLSLTNFSGSASDVLLGTGSFGSMNSLAWQLTGNSGTNPTSNFIGTTDAQDFVVRTNNQERIRVLSSGAVRIGYGTNASDALQVGGYGSVNPTVFIGSTGGGAPGYGSIRLYGTTYGTDAIHIRGGGLTYFNTGNQYVFGRNTPVDANDLFSVQASSTYPWAINAYTNVSGAGAIYGQATGALSYGVWGETNDNTSIGVVGNNSSTTANFNARGVQGQTANPSGTGVVGINTSTTANTYACGVWGETYNPAGNAGFFYNSANLGTNSGNGIWGITRQSSGFGVRAENLYTSGTALVAAGNGITPSYLTSGTGASIGGSALGLFVYQDGPEASNEGAALFYASTVPARGVYVAYRFGNTNYKIVNVGGFGGIASTDVWGLTNDTNDRKLMFAPEAPEIVLLDFGTAKLVNGKAYVKLDPIFSRNIVVNENHPLRVFIQLEGNCNGVYVTNKTKEGFEVIELNNGTSNVEFSWFVIANRADYINPITGNLISKHEGVRFPQAPNAPKIERVKQSALDKTKNIEREIELKPLEIKKAKENK